MNLLLSTAVMIATINSPAQAEPETYQLTMEAHAVGVTCPAANNCFRVQNQIYSAPKIHPLIDEEFTVAFIFECDRDERCVVIDMYNSD